MRRKAIWILCALALGLLALGAAGCGGGGDSTTTVTVASSDTTTDETTTEAETTTEEDTTTDESDTTTESSDTDTTTTSPDLSFISNENCRQFVQFASDFAQALSGTGDTDLQASAEKMSEFADEAPEDIRDDFKTLSEYYSKVADALKGVDVSSGQTPSADVLAKLASLSQDIDSSKVQEASENISNWTQENCTNG